MIPVPNVSYTDVGPPQTKIGAWLQAIGLFAILIVMEALYAGIFAMGFYGIFSAVTGEAFSMSLTMMIVGIFATTFWPIMIWNEVKEAFLFAWKFKK